MLAGIVLNEGFVCIAMATPLFALVAIVIGKYLEWARSKNNARLMSVVILLPMVLEGVFPSFEFSRNEVVSLSREFAISGEQVRQRLAKPLALTKTLPLFLQMGFPQAKEVRGEGLDIGSTRCIYFAGGEGTPGDLCLQIQDVLNNRVVFQLAKDDSHIAHWLSWKTATVSWQEKSPGKVEVTWTLAYDRELDPYWYFAPLERYGVRLAAQHLLANYFEN